MTGRERVRCAMERQQPDRVPFFCQLSIGHYLRQLGLDSADLWLHNDTLIDAFCTLALRYDMDGVLINLPGRDPAIDRRLARREQRGDEEWLWFAGYDSPLVCPRANLPHHPDLRHTPLADLDPAKLFYEDPHTIGGLKPAFHYDLDGPVAADESLFPGYLTAIIDGVLARVGDRLSVHSEVFSPFTQFMERLGYEAGLMALLDEPERCHAVLARFAAGAGALGRLQAAHGVDAVLISSAFAGGGFISAATYREFVLPYESRVVELIHTAGVKVYTHTCGHIADRLELMADSGIDGIDTMDPPPLGNTELAAAKQRVGGRLFLKGNVDSVNVLLNGTPQQAYQAAERAIRAASTGGGYILSSACSVAPGVPAENLHAMRQAALDAG